MHVSLFLFCFCLRCSNNSIYYLNMFAYFISISAGAVDEESFVKAFEDVPTVQIYSPKEVSEQMKSITDIISDPNKDWNKRVTAVSILEICFQ